MIKCRLKKLTIDKGTVDNGLLSIAFFVNLPSARFGRRAVNYFIITS